MRCVVLHCVVPGEEAPREQAWYQRHAPVLSPTRTTRSGTNPTRVGTSSHENQYNFLPVPRVLVQTPTRVGANSYWYRCKFLPGHAQPRTSSAYLLRACYAIAGTKRVYHTRTTGVS
eukprot:169684-Rhodomonas_salina.1